MEQLRGAGHAVGEYVGGGRGEPEDEDRGSDGEDCELIDELEETDEDEETTDNTAHPPLFFFDTEITGLNIYQDHIVELAAKVIGVPLSSVTQPTFSSLVHTPRNIPTKGTLVTI